MTTAPAPQPSRRSLRALDALTFFAPDIQGGVGPFLVVFMSATLAWEPQRIGTVMFASALVGLLVQAPAGALIDRVRAKPRWIAGAAVAIAVSLLAMVSVPEYAVILVGQSVIGAAGTLVGPAVAAVSLGLVGRHAMDARVGRNAAIGAAGTVLWALGTGGVGHALGAHTMFLFAMLMAVPVIVAALAIRNADIDHTLARGGDAPDEARIASASSSRGLNRGFAVLLLCAFLFHLSNAAMLTLVAQRIGAVVGAQAALWLSGGVIVGQLVMIPIGLAVGRWASRLPRKPIFLVAFAVLPLRALLYMFTPDPAGMIALQVLDGVGAGVFGVMLTLMVSDLARGSGRFNAALGLSAVAVGLGAALSNLLAGAVAQSAGYATSFLVLGAIAALALVLFVFAMPETRRVVGDAPAPTAPLAATSA